LNVWKKEKVRMSNKVNLLIVTALFAVALMLSPELRADTDAKALQEQLLAYEFPIASELKPEYPTADTSAIAAFRVQLHRDFSAMLELDAPGDSVGVLGAYLTARDQWLKSGALTETVLASYITMAIDAYLVRSAYDKPDSIDVLKPWAERNSIKGTEFIAAIDKALQQQGSAHTALSELCDGAGIMPKESCWITYIQQFGLSYTEETFENMHMRFLDAPLGSTENPLSRLGMFEAMSRNPVFVLHVQKPSYLIQFAAYLMDGQRIRAIAWEHAANITPELEKSEQIAQGKPFLEAFAPAGARWLASESYADDADLNMKSFLIKCKSGSRNNDFLKPIAETDAMIFGQYMAMVK
jgi:hypothetical protein